MSVKRPDFLKDIQLTEGDYAFWAEGLTNGFATQNFLKDNRKSLTAYDIEIAMCIECEADSPRWYVLQRLKSALNEHRRNEEDKLFLEWFRDIRNPGE
jgi:hypothetical protein